MSVKSLDFYKGLKDEMLSADKKRDEMFLWMEQAHHLVWDLPATLQKQGWIRKYISTDPYNGFVTIRRLLSTVVPDITYQVLQPISGNPAVKEQANKIERGLRWQLLRADRRPKANVVGDAVLSAARCDEVCAMVLPVEWQGKLTGMSKKRMQMAKRHGDFAVSLKNPRFVHSRFSEWGLEEVLFVNVRKAESAVDLWGKKASAIQTELEKEENQAKDLYFCEYDLWDLDVHTTWGFLGEAARLNSDEGIEITIQEPKEHRLPFIPAIVRVGGTNLDLESEYQRYPLLYAVFKAGQWATTNIMGTLEQSEVLALTTAPKTITYSPDPNNPPEIEYGQIPGGSINVRMGTEDAKPFQPPQLDQNLVALMERYKQSMQESTVSRVLMMGEYPAGAAYAAINLMTQSAVKSVSPVKRLAEEALADVCCQMLNWTKHMGKPLVGFGSQVSDMGTQYVINPDDFDTENLFITVELTADVPTDRQGRINAAAMARRELGMSQERGLEEAGVEDPISEINQSYYEKMKEMELQLYFEREKAKLQLEMQAQQMQLQMQAQQAQMQQQMAAQQEAQQQGGGGQAPMQQGPQGMPGVSGQGYNPAQGGQPPAQVNPNVTRETQTGQARGGVPTYQGGVE